MFHDTLVPCAERRNINMNKEGQTNSNIEKRGFSLPTTLAKPPMPAVKPPKKDDNNKKEN